jgi:acetyl-CoA carboxylase alpha subunit
MGKLLDEVLVRSLAELRGLSTEELLARRYDKFRRMGRFFQLA